MFYNNSADIQLHIHIDLKLLNILGRRDSEAGEPHKRIIDEEFR